MPALLGYKGKFTKYFPYSHSDFIMHDDLITKI